MVLVLLLAAVLWGIGALLGAPRPARWLMIGLLYVAVLAVQVGFPTGHPLRLATGESPALWLILGGFAALIVAYGTVVRKLRDRARAGYSSVTPASGRSFSETELNRYARHIVLREIGGSGQKALKDAKVLVVGAGGLGAPVLQYLAAAGVGTIGVIDDDVVENANLQRQVIHRDLDIGMPKVFSAKQAMEAQNPFVSVKPYHRRLTEEIAGKMVGDYDLVIDGTDNFDTRYLVNAASVARRVPLISGALTQWEGQVSVFDPANDAPCYQCVFPKAPSPELAPNCAEAGVVGPLPGVVGSMMAVEAIKVLTGAGTPLRGTLVIYDALFGESRQISIARRADCETCGNNT